MPGYSGASGSFPAAGIMNNRALYGTVSAMRGGCHPRSGRLLKQFPDNKICFLDELKISSLNKKKIFLKLDICSKKMQTCTNGKCEGLQPAVCVWKLKRNVGICVATRMKFVKTVGVFPTPVRKMMAIFGVSKTKCVANPDNVAKTELASMRVNQMKWRAEPMLVVKHRTMKSVTKDAVSKSTHYVNVKIGCPIMSDKSPHMPVPVVMTPNAWMNVPVRLVSHAVVGV